MSITTTQKIIRIGSSKGAIYAAKDLKRLGVDVGDELTITIEVSKKQKNDVLMQEYAAFKAEYGETLKNLADR